MASGYETRRIPREESEKKVGGGSILVVAPAGCWYPTKDVNP